MQFSTPQNLAIQSCTPQTLRDPTQYVELHNVPYGTAFDNKNDIYVLYKDKAWKFESWNGGSGQAAISPVQGNTTGLNIPRKKYPVITSCKFYRKVPFGILFNLYYLFTL